MKNLFVNGSPNANGNTANLAAALFKGQAYETLNLVDYRINAYGQSLSGDQLDEVLAKIEQADVVAVGSPLYWHNICGSVRNMLDRCYGKVRQGGLSGRKLVFLFQGAAPEKWMLEAGDYTISRFAGLYGLEYMGMATNAKEAAAMAGRL